MKNLIGIVLIIVGIGLGIWGFQKYESDSGDVKIGDVEITVSKEGHVPVLTWAAAAASLVVGILLVAQSDRKIA